jgi:sortase B
MGGLGKHSSPQQADDVRVSPRRRRGGGCLSTLLILVGMALLAYAAFLWGSARLRYWQQEKVNRELAEFTIVDDERGGPKVDWAGLKAINDEIIGWIEIPGTTINYPVYQASDNEKYLRHSATGEWTVGGQLFADCEGTRPGMVDALTLVYGHHLLDGSMFEQIADMDKQERFDEIDTVWYVTEQAAWECEPLLLSYTQPDDQDARIFNWPNYDEFRLYLYERLERAVTSRPDAAAIITGTNHVLCMITCNYYDGYGRTVLVCVPKAEAAAALAAVGA